MAQITNMADLNVKTYSCGSQRLAHNIKTVLNIQPVNVYENKAGKIINVFILTPKLSEFLTQWTQNKPKKKREVQSG
ncbi:MAG: hypothetical protein WC240_05165 [Bacilli bacterium]